MLKDNKDMSKLVKITDKLSISERLKRLIIRII